MPTETTAEIDHIPNNPSDFGGTDLGTLRAYVDDLGSRAAALETTPALHAATHASGGTDPVDHDTLTNFVSAEHTNHATLYINQSNGVGITQGGSLISSRTLNVWWPHISSFDSTPDRTADYVATFDVDANAMKKVLLEDLLLAPLTLTGTSDSQQLLVIGDTAQTANIVQVENKAGTRILSAHNNEQVYVRQLAGQLAGATSDTDTYLDLTNSDSPRMYAGGLEFWRCSEAVKDEMIFNNAGVDIDFSVNSNNVTALFKIDGGADEVGINGVGNGLFGIQAFADEVQFFVRGHASQSANIVEVESSGSTAYFQIDSSGYTLVADRLGHIGDADTYLAFAADNLSIFAGADDLADFDGTNGVTFNPTSGAFDTTINSDNDKFWCDASADDFIFGTAALSTGFVSITARTGTIPLVCKGATGQAIMSLQSAAGTAVFVVNSAGALDAVGGYFHDGDEGLSETLTLSGVSQITVSGGLITGWVS